MAKGALIYMREQLGQGFLVEYQKLDDADKATLKAWAEQEIKVLGITE
jgi:hypothetical protein